MAGCFGIKRHKKLFNLRQSKELGDDFINTIIQDSNEHDIKTFLQKIDLESQYTWPAYRDDETIDFVHYVAAKGSVKAMRCLVDIAGKKIVKRKTQYEVWGTLHFAVEYINNEMIQGLISLDADINSPNARGRTPLHLACENKNVGAVRELCTIARLDIQDNEQKTALAIAEKNRCDPIITLLQQVNKGDEILNKVAQRLTEHDNRLDDHENRLCRLENQIENQSLCTPSLQDFSFEDIEYEYDHRGSLRLPGRGPVLCPGSANNPRRQSRNRLSRADSGLSMASSYQGERSGLDRELYSLAKNINPGNMYGIGLWLEFTKAELDQIERDKAKDSLRCMFEVLAQWSQKCQGDVTRMKSKLAEALEANGHTDLAKQMDNMQE